jgi:glyoxalase family protein
MTRSAGLHHVTALSGNIRRTHDFYTRVLGLRCVKKTVNFDDAASWHLYYGDTTGTAGTLITFFSWEDTRAGKAGAGETVAVAFSIPPGSAAWWAERLSDEGVRFALDTNTQSPVIALHDPDGLALELIEEEPHGLTHPHTEEIAPEQAITGLASATLLVKDLEATARVIMDVFGWHETGRAALPGFERLRFESGAKAPATRLELLRGQNVEDARRGTGSVHHLAFRAENDTSQAELVAELRRLGIETTPVLDRTYFRSVYFREPSGVLFEIATDTPGFTVDENIERLGESVKLPEKLQDKREVILAKLPEL